MRITDADELHAFERALSLQARRDRESCRMRNGDRLMLESAQRLERMLLRMYKEHFPVAYEQEHKRFVERDATTIEP